jgi:DNA-binding beta-propeller fold protein YncE
VQQFGPDGLFICAFGTKGSGNGQFLSPHGVAVDSVGNIVVADSHNLTIING